MNDGSLGVTWAPLDDRIPQLGLTGLNVGAVGIVLGEGVPKELCVHLQAKCRQFFDESHALWSPQMGRTVQAVLCGEMLSLVAQGWLRRSLVNPRRWVFDLPTP